MRVILSCVVVALACVVCCTAERDVVWQGFRHQWLREVTNGLRTPHRLGSFASTLSPMSSSGNVTATTEFTPGVNGDYSHPEVFYSEYTSNSITTTTKDVLVTFTDNSKIDQTTNLPEAQTTKRSQVNFTLPTGIHTYTAFLRGWNVQMLCDPAKQPAGEECNSNGVWPYDLSLSVGNCTSGGSNVACWVNITLNRGIAPIETTDNPFRKPFNYVMDFNFTVSVTFAHPSSATGQFSSTLPQTFILSSGRVYPGDDMKDTGHIFVNPGYGAGTVAVTGFSYKLNPVEGVPAKGRYLEWIDAHVADLGILNRGFHSFNYTLAWGTTKSTWPIDVTASISVVLLQFPNGDGSVKPSTSASGTICMSDQAFPFTFRCRLKGLKPTTTDTFTIPV